MTYEEIKVYIIANYVNERAAAGLPYDNPALWSKTNIRRLWVNIMASLFFILTELFRVFKEDTESNLKELKPHSIRWYVNAALNYQHGFSLLAESDQFNNIGYTDVQIENSRVVKYAAVQEQINQFGRVSLRMKLAGTYGSDLKELEPPQLAGVRAYFARVKDAGVALTVTSDVADAIKMKWDVYYDPLILNSNGERLDGTDSTPVRTAIKNFLKNLSFNGVYVPTYHVDAVQVVEGVVYPVIKEVSAKYGSFTFLSIANEYQPDSGYLRFYNEDDLVINFIPRQKI